MKIIFQIGFNKCGSTSLHKFFTQNSIKSIHWDEGKLSSKIYENFKCSRGLLTGYEGYQAFTDMIDEDDVSEREVHVDLFTNLYDEFPDAIYIFNDRDPSDWIESRINHRQGDYAARAQKRLGARSIDEVKGYWLGRYHEHKRRVLDFFDGKDQFIHFDINDKKSIDTLINTLSSNGFNLKSHEFPHSNRNVKNFDVSKAPDYYADIFRDFALFFEDRDPDKAHHLMEVAHLIRPAGPLIKRKLDEYKAKGLNNCETIVRDKV